jgi:hypothetical protein
VSGLTAWSYLFSAVIPLELQDNFWSVINMKLSFRGLVVASVATVAVHASCPDYASYSQVSFL